MYLVKSWVRDETVRYGCGLFSFLLGFVQAEKGWKGRYFSVDEDKYGGLQVQFWNEGSGKSPFCLASRLVLATCEGVSKHWRFMTLGPCQFNRFFV